MDIKLKQKEILFLETSYENIRNIDCNISSYGLKIQMYTDPRSGNTYYKLINDTGNYCMDIISFNTKSDEHLNEFFLYLIEHQHKLSDTRKESFLDYLKDLAKQVIWILS